MSARVVPYLQYYPLLALWVLLNQAPTRPTFSYGTFDLLYHGRIGKILGNDSEFFTPLRGKRKKKRWDEEGLKIL